LVHTWLKQAFDHALPEPSAVHLLVREIFVWVLVLDASVERDTLNLVLVGAVQHHDMHLPLVAGRCLPKKSKQTCECLVKSV
jgi:hypothetical protein